MTINLNDLKDELDNDPVSLGYSGKTTLQRKDLLNSKTTSRTIKKPIDIANILVWAGGNGVLKNIKAEADNYLSSVNSPALAAWKLMEKSTNETLNVENPSVIAMLDAFVSASVMTSTQMTELLAMADNTVSRAVELFGKEVDYQDVESAEAL